MANKKISQLPSGQLLPQTIFPIVTNGTTSQTTFDGLVNALNPLISGGTGGQIGPMGPQGPQGPVGPTGADGIQGPAGQDGAAGAQGPVGPVGPAGLNWQGLWDMDTQYVTDDAVGFSGASWFCIADVTTTGNDDPTIDTTHWALLAAQGAQGPMGPQGVAGIQGPQGATGPQGPQGPMGPAASAATLTNASFYVSNSQPYNVLAYDINATYGSGTCRLPENAPVGKIITIRNNFSNIQVQAFDGQPKISNYGANGSTSSVWVNAYETKQFVSLGSNYWYVIAIQGESSTFNGTPINFYNLWNIAETYNYNNALVPLSTAELNSLYPNGGTNGYNPTPIGAKVYCPNIANGGRVYIKTSYNTWTSLPLVPTSYSGATSGLNTFVTGGTYNAGTATFTNNTGGTFSVSGFSTGGDTFWVSGSSGTSSIKRPLFGNDATGNYSMNAGFASVASGEMAAAFNYSTKATGYASHAEGYATSALTQTGSHSEGYHTLAEGLGAHAEGQNSIANGTASHAEGYLTVANGYAAHAEGQETSATTYNTHAEGIGTLASALAAHAEGYNSQAIGIHSHAQNTYNIASGFYSHAGGSGSTAQGIASFVHSTGSIVYGDRSAVLGGSGITANANDTVYVPNLVIKKVDAVPTSSADSIGEAGSVTWDANYFYWKTESDGWLRVSGSTF